MSFHDREQKGNLAAPTRGSISLPNSPTSKAQYRLVIMGAANVGKSSIISRFLYEEFKAEYTATVEEMHRGEYEVAGMPLTLDILDTSGSYPFPAMRKLSISTGDAFVLVYSVKDSSSFEEVKALRQLIIEEKGEEAMTPIVVVGNKAEVSKEEREVGQEVAESTASIEWGHGYVEASAKEDTNIVGIFKELFLQADLHVGNAFSPAVRKGREGMSSNSAGGRRVSLKKLKKQESCTIS